jgi:hypothetical protein
MSNAMRGIAARVPQITGAGAAKEARMMDDYLLSKLARQRMAELHAEADR